MVSCGSRGEKLSSFKLTVVQYGILLMMLGLAACYYDELSRT